MQMSAKRSEKRETNTIKMRGPKKAIVRSQNGAAKGRGCWERSRWPDAKLEVGGAKRGLRNDQQRDNEKREEKRDHKNSRQNFEERSAKGALRNEQQLLRRDGRKQKEERREKRASGRQLDSPHIYMIQEGRDGAEKGRALGERTEERKEKREGEDNHN